LSVTEWEARDERPGLFRLKQDLDPAALSRVADGTCARAS